VEDQHRLDPPIGDEQAVAGELRQLPPEAHGSTL
jgi:hypothetical protein